jgi:hypothetical protein
MISTASVSVELRSSLLASAIYDASQSILQLEFRDGAIYRYFQISPRLYQELLRADSHGTYFNRHIRGHGPYLRLQHPS